MAAGVQIAMTYDAVEDRILMRHRVGSKDVRLWITRRLAQSWIAGVARILDHVQGIEAQPAAQRRAVGRFQRESAVRGADFRKPYEEAETALEPFPPEGPMLVAKLTFTARKNGALELLFAEADTERSVKIPISQRELHGLTHMLTLAARKGGWGLSDPNLPDASAPKAPPARVN